MLHWSVKCFRLEIEVVWESCNDEWVLTGTVAVSSSAPCKLWVQSCTRFGTSPATSADQRASKWCDHVGVCCGQLCPVRSADAATCRCSRTRYRTELHYNSQASQQPWHWQLSLQHHRVTESSFNDRTLAMQLRRIYDESSDLFVFDFWSLDYAAKYMNRN